MEKLQTEGSLCSADITSYALQCIKSIQRSKLFSGAERDSAALFLDEYRSSLRIIMGVRSGFEYVSDKQFHTAAKRVLVS